MITARIEPTELVSPEERPPFNDKTKTYTGYTIHGYSGDNKVVHNLAIYTDLNPLQGELPKLEKRWNSDDWQNRNGINRFMANTTPKGIR